MTRAEEVVDRELRIAEGFARAGNPSAAVARLRTLVRRLRRPRAGLPEAVRARLLERVGQAEANHRRQAEAWESQVRARAARYRERERAAARSRPTDG